MKTRSILVMLALGAIVAMAFTFTSTTTVKKEDLTKVEIPKGLSPIDAEKYAELAAIPLGIELVFNNADGTESWTELLTEERKNQMLNNIEKEKAKSWDCGGGIMTCSANRWYCCIITMTGSHCYFVGLGNCSNP